MGAYTPFAQDAAIRHWEAETEKPHAEGFEGPVPYEEKDGDDKQVVYYVETLRSKRVEETMPAILRKLAKQMVNIRQKLYFGYTVIVHRS